MKYTIKNVGQSRQYQYNGAQLISYAFQINDNGQDIWCEVSQKPEKPAPKVGEEIEGEIKYSQNPQYSHKFKRSFTGTGFKGGYKNDPQVQASIVRQSSLAQAVSFSIARDPITMTPESVIEVAKIFAKFASGEEIKPEATNPTPQPQNSATTPNTQPKDTPFEGNDIDVSDIPF